MSRPWPSALLAKFRPAPAARKPVVRRPTLALEGLEDRLALTGFTGTGVKWHDGFSQGGEVPLTGDFDGDGRADLATLTRGTTGDVFVVLSSGSGFTGTGVKWHDSFCYGDEVPLAADFNGDGRTDLATLTRGGTGDVFVALSTGSGFTGTGVKWHDNFCYRDEIPLAGDFDGDRKADLAAFTRGTTGDVFVALSTGSGFSGSGAKWHDSFCYAGELPLAADFDGDGRADLVALTRGSTGDVFVALSTGVAFAGVGAKCHDSFCYAGELPLAADFDGDRKADLAALTQGTTADVFVTLAGGAVSPVIPPTTLPVAPPVVVKPVVPPVTPPIAPPVVPVIRPVAPLPTAGSSPQPASVPVYDSTGAVVGRRSLTFLPTRWAEEGYRATDIRQMRSGICVIASTLASAASTRLDLASRIRYLGNFQYQVRLYEFGWQTVRFDGYVYSSDLLPKEAKSADGRATSRLKNFWPLLFARAYLQAQGVNWATNPGPDDKFWDNGVLGFRPGYVSPKNAGFAVAGGDKNNWDTSEGSTAIRHLANNLKLGSVVTVGTDSPRYGAGNGSGHQWAVVGLSQDAAGTRVRLYNPWGYDGDQGAIEGANDGYVTLTWSEFAAAFDTMTMVTRAGVGY